MSPSRARHALPQHPIRPYLRLAGKLLVGFVARQVMHAIIDALELRELLEVLLSFWPW